MDKEKRWAIIRELIAENEIETQEQLIHLLNERGVTVTQATISRDLKEMNIVRTSLFDDRNRYILPKDTSFQPEESLKHFFDDALIKLDRVAQFVIIKTLPGNAHAIGAILDKINWEEIVGTICGNDTCLVITKSDENSNKVLDRLHQMMN